MSPAINLGDVFALVGVHLQQAADALGPRTSADVDAVALLQMARIHADERQLTDKRIGHDLEGQRRKRRLVVGGTLDFLAGVGIFAFDRRNIERRRQIVDDRVQQRLHAFVLESRSADHREHLHLQGRAAQRGLQLGLADGFAFDVLVHQLVLIVVFHDRFDEDLMVGLGLLLQLFRDFLDFVLGAHGLVMPDDGLHRHQVDDALELVFLADGQLDGNRAGIQALADGVDGVLEIGAHLVNLVDEANARNAVLVGLAPDGLRLRLDPMHGVEHGARAVEHAQRTLHLGGEVHVAGRIDNVDANVFPEAGRSRRRDGDAALLLLRHPIHRRRAFMDLTNAVRASCIEQDALRGGGLTGIDVGHDADIPATI